MKSENTVCIGLCNPKSAQNMGSILRAANCFGVHEILFTGTRYLYAARHNTDTKKAAQWIKMQQVNDLLQNNVFGREVVCVELVENATPLPEFVHPANALYVFGPEDGTIPQGLINDADHVVYIPTKTCLNLAAAVNILLYDRMAKLGQFPSDNSLIKSSRDLNNHTLFHSKLCK